MALSQPSADDGTNRGPHHERGASSTAGRMREDASTAEESTPVRADRALSEDLESRCRRLVWIPALAGFALSLGGWLAVPFLFIADPEILRHLQLFYSALGLQSLVVVSLLAILGSEKLRALSRGVGQGHAVSPKVRRGAGQETVRLPSLIGGMFVVQSFVLSFGTALRGHLRFDVPIDVVAFSTIFGVALGFFGGCLVGTILRMQMAPFTRLLSRIGLESWPGRQRRFASKVATICGLVAFLPALLIGTVGYYFADRIVTNQLSGTLSVRLVQLLEATGDEGLGPLTPDELRARLDRLADLLHPRADLALARDGEVLGGTSEGLEKYLSLRSVQELSGRVGNAVAPDSRCLLLMAPAPAGQGDILVRIPREVVGRSLGPMQATMFALIISTMLLSILLGWVSAKTMQIPLSEVARITTRVARGDLSDPGGRVLTDDAFGELASEVAGMRARLATTVQRVVDLSKDVGSSAQTTIDQAQQIGLGAEAQVAAVSSVSSANRSLDGGLREVAETVRRVASTFREATESGSQVDEEFEALARDIEALASEAREAAGAVGELSEGMESVAEDVTVLSEAAERATHAAGEVDQSLERMREHSGGAAEAAKRSITAAKGGAKSVRHTVQGIERIRSESEKAVARVENLSKRISEVDKVLAVIDDIAEKTNLLALNASIIAAQAGEQGRSFAVVAGEVRDLATRTAASTREISGTVQDVRAASFDAVGVIKASGELVEDGVNLASEAECSLEEILQTAHEASAAAGEIAVSTDLQSKKVSEVRREINQVAEMASRIADVGEARAGAASSARSAAEKMASLTLQMNQVISSLTERNRELISTFTDMGAPVAQVDQALEMQARAMSAINEENARIRHVATASADLAERLDQSARTIEEAADALAIEVRYFRL